MLGKSRKDKSIKLDEISRVLERSRLQGYFTLSLDFGTETILPRKSGANSKPTTVEPKKIIRRYYLEASIEIIAVGSRYCEKFKVEKKIYNEMIGKYITMKNSDKFMYFQVLIPTNCTIQESSLQFFILLPFFIQSTVRFFS